MKQFPLVVAVLGAALLGGMVGGWLRAPGQRVEAAPRPAPAVEHDPRVLRELEALRREMRAASKAEVSESRESRRSPATSTPPVSEDAASIQAQLLGLREAMRTLEDAVREETALGPPTDAVLNARLLDREAVQQFIDSHQADPDRAREELIGLPYEVLLQRFGRPYEIWPGVKPGRGPRWFWRGWGDRDPKLGVGVEFVGGLAGNLTLHSW